MATKYIVQIDRLGCTATNDVHESVVEDRKNDGWELLSIIVNSHAENFPQIMYYWEKTITVPGPNNAPGGD